MKALDEGSLVNLLNCIIKLKENSKIKIDKNNKIKTLGFDIYYYSFIDEKEYNLEMILAYQENKEASINYFELKKYKLSKFGITPENENEDKNIPLDPVGITSGYFGTLNFFMTIPLKKGYYELMLKLDDKILAIAPFDIELC